MCQGVNQDERETQDTRLQKKPRRDGHASPEAITRQSSAAAVLIATITVGNGSRGTYCTAVDRNELHELTVIYSATHQHKLSLTPLQPASSTATARQGFVPRRRVTGENIVILEQRAKSLSNQRDSSQQEGVR